MICPKWRGFLFLSPITLSLEHLYHYTKFRTLKDTSGFPTNKSHRKSFIVLLSVTEPGTILRTSHILTNEIFTEVICVIFYLIIQMKKMQYREVKKFTLITYLNKSKNEDSNSGSLPPEPVLLITILNLLIKWLSTLHCALYLNVENFESKWSLLAGQDCTQNREYRPASHRWTFGKTLRTVPPRK